jgi:predicted small integral membrane protein
MENFPVRASRVSPSLIADAFIELPWIHWLAQQLMPCFDARMVSTVRVFREQ